MGDKQDPQAGIGPVLRPLHDLRQRHGRHTHAQKAAGAEQAGVHRNDDLGKQQNTDVRLLLQSPKSQIWAEVRSDLHRHGQPAVAHPDRRRVQRHEGLLMALRHKQLLLRPSALRFQKQKGLGQDERRVRWRADRRSGGAATEDVLNQESE